MKNKGLTYLRVFVFGLLIVANIGIAESKDKSATYKSANELMRLYGNIPKLSKYGDGSVYSGGMHHDKFYYVVPSEINKTFFVVPDHGLASYRYADDRQKKAKKTREIYYLNQDASSGESYNSRKERERTDMYRSLTYLDFHKDHKLGKLKSLVWIVVKSASDIISNGDEGLKFQSNYPKRVKDIKKLIGKRRFDNDQSAFTNAFTEMGSMIKNLIEIAEANENEVEDKIIAKHRLKKLFTDRHLRNVKTLIIKQENQM